MNLKHSNLAPEFYLSMKNILLIAFSLIMILGPTCFVSIGQDVNINNLSSIDVDELSDEQVDKFKSKVLSSGLSEDQLILMAKSRGMSEIQISKLRSRLNGLDGNQTLVTQTDGLNRMRQNSPIYLAPIDSGYGENTTQLSDLFAEMFVDQKKLKIFGQEFFNNAQLTFEPGLNMPTPSNYILGAGDELIIDIWGASEQTYQLVISPEGSIMIQNLGPVFVAGMELNKAKSKIIGRMKRIYSSIGSSSFADVSLGKIRSINVHVIGEVNNRGTFTVSSFSTVFNALYSAGGPSSSGSMRKIEVFRNKKLLSTFDAYDFLVNGTGDNITLQDQDVIIVRSYVSRVVFRGAVKRPAIYELLEKESMQDLLKFSGGYSERAYKGAISLRRIEGNFKTVKTFNSETLEDFELKNGDEIVVNTISNEFINRVTIEGPVYNPNEYELVDGMTLKNLIEVSNGLKGDAFLDRAIIIRENYDHTLANIAVNLNDVLDETVLFPLQNNDIIKIQSIFSLRERYSITISGEVQNPGSYSYVDGMKVEDMIFLAGGFKESAAKSFVEVARRLNSNEVTDMNLASKIFNFPINENLTLSENDSDFLLEPFDLIVIRTSPFRKIHKVVEVAGEVIFPGKYVLESKEERISSLLERAGGVTDFSYVEGATLIRRTEYYQSERNNDGFANDAVRIRKEDLRAIFFKDDTLAMDGSNIFRQQEAIGIDLSAVISSPGGIHDLILKQGDILSIPQKIQTVRVRGEALFPTNVQYKEGANLKYYVSRAGGFEQKSKKSKSYIIYANNAAAKTQRILWFKKYPRVRPGAEIVIPKKEDRERMSAQAWVALSSSIATLALVINQLAK